MIKINLLPQGRKEEIKWHQASRLVIFYGIIILMAAGIFISLLFAVQIFLQRELSSLDGKIQLKQKSIRTQELKDLEIQIKAFNGEILKLNKIQAEHIYYSEFLENFTKIIPKDIQLFVLDIQRADKNSKENLYKVSMIGKAKTREDLLAFKKALEKTDDFQDLYLPLSSLTKRYDVDFTFNMFLKQEALRKY